MLNRLDFLRLGGGVGTAALVHAPFKTIAQVAAASAAVADRTPEDVAADEFYWREIQEAFTLDRTLTNLNNGNTCPSPRVVHEACKRYMDMANMLPVQYNGMIGRNIQTVRRRLAAEFGCDVEELALTRNASESLQIAQNGLDLKPGDEVLDDRAGLPAHADDVGPARAARQDQGHAHPVPGADDAGRSVPAFRAGDHAADEGPALLSHHEPHGPAVSGAAAHPAGARRAAS